MQYGREVMFFIRELFFGDFNRPGRPPATLAWC
jgi:hypothetical protein